MLKKYIAPHLDSHHQIQAEAFPWKPDILHLCSQTLLPKSRLTCMATNPALIMKSLTPTVTAANILKIATNIHCFDNCGNISCSDRNVGWVFLLYNEKAAWPHCGESKARIREWSSSTASRHPTNFPHRALWKEREGVDWNSQWIYTALYSPKFYDP